MIKGVTERIDSQGKIAIPLYEEEVREGVSELCREGVEGIAVALLWSFLNNSHERRVGEIIREMAPEMPVSLSHEVIPLVREYPRFNSTIINLYIGKPVRKLLSKVNDKLNSLGYTKPLLVMQAAGGLSRSEVVHPVTTLHSGPVGGLRGVEFFKGLYGYENVIGSDVGGTSFDVTLSPRDGAEYIREPIVSRFHLANPMLEVKCIGAGGGTVAYVDELTGVLRVGPRSAGAMPGPVCYDLGGTEPTVTDADLVMNRIDPEYFLGGKMKLNKDKAIAAIKEKIADPMRMEVVEAAHGICRIIDDTMKATVSAILGERGFDPKDFVLFAFGGGGPAHCAGYSEGMGFKKTIVPPFAATFSAFGAATSDVMHRYVESAYIVIPAFTFNIVTRELDLSSLDQVPPEALERFNQVFDGLEQRAFEDMKEEGFRREELKTRCQMEVRYGGQLYEVVCTSPVNRITSLEDFRAVIKAFEDEYRRLYTKGAMYPQGGVEIITLILEVSASTVKPDMVKRAFKGKDPSSALKGKREVFFEGGFVETNIYAMDRLENGNFIKGPAIIEGVDTTVVVPGNFIVTVDEYLNMVMEQVE